MTQGTRSVCVCVCVCVSQPLREEARVEIKNSLVMAFEDNKYPVTEGRMLVSLLRHTPSIFLNWVLRNRRPLLFAVRASKGEERSYAYRLATITGFNVGINDGIGAGQTIMHCPTSVI
jgi:diadenosine tetraphosphate (Ap4A) HIT family hydrolase